MAYIVKRTALAGGADPTVAGRLGVWGLMHALLTEAGWTVIDERSFTEPVGQTATERVYYSTGESGREAIYLRLWTTTAAVDNFRHQVLQYWDVATHTGYNVLSTHYTHYWDMPAATVYDYVGIADKDSVVFFWKDAATAYGRWIDAGNFIRNPGTHGNNLRTLAPLAPGVNVRIDLSEAPGPLGYTRGLNVIICAQQPATPPVQYGVIPVHMACIQEVGADYIIVDRVLDSFAAGAILGPDPMPYYQNTADGLADVQANGVLYTGNVFDRRLANLFRDGYYNLGGGQAYSNTAWRPTLTTCDPNLRTGRVVLDRLPLLVYEASNVGQLRGYRPKIFGLPRNSDPIWTIARTPKTTPPRDYVVVSADTVNARMAIGPVT